MMRPLPTTEEYSLEWLAGIAIGVAAGKTPQAQLAGARNRCLNRLQIDAGKVELTIVNRKALPRAGAT
jgi:hypothetical protein